MATRSAGAITVSFKALTEGLNKGIDKAEKKVSGFGGKLKGFAGNAEKIGGGMVAVGGGMAAIGAGITGAMGVASAKSGQFNKEMAEVQTLIPGTGNRIKDLRKDVLDLSKELGIMTNEATNGLYNLISAFGDTSDTTKLLEINTKAAKAGVATLSDSIALTSAVTKTYGDTTAEGQQKATDLAFTAVKLGQTTFPELANSIGAVTPLAKNLNVSQEELFATMATLTGVTGSASEVSTQFRGALQALSSPTKDMEDLITKLGFANGGAMVESLGMAGALESITKEAQRTGKPLQSYIGSIEGQTLALALNGENAEKYRIALDEMGSSAGATDEAFNTLTNGMGKQAFQAEQARAKTEVLWIEMGQKLAPIVLTLTEHLNRLLDWGINFVNQNPGVIQTIAIVGGVLLGLGTVVTTVGGFLIGLAGTIKSATFIFGLLKGAGIATSVVIAGVTVPVWAVIGAVTALIAIGVALWANWDWISAKATEAWGWIARKTGEAWNAVTTATSNAWNFVSNRFSRGIDGIKNITSNGWNAITGFFRKGIDKANSSVSNGIETIKGTFQSGMNFISGLIDPVMGKLRRLGNMAGGLKDRVGGGISAARGVIPGFAQGGFIGNSGVRINRSNGDNRLLTITARDDEFMTTRKQRDNIFEAIANGKMTGKSKSGGDTYNINAVDSQSFIDMIKREGSIIKRTLKIA